METPFRFQNHSKEWGEAMALEGTLAEPVGNLPLNTTFLERVVPALSPPDPAFSINLS